MLVGNYFVNWSFVPLRGWGIFFGMSYLFTFDRFSEENSLF